MKPMPPTQGEAAERILAVLTGYVSGPTARSICNVAYQHVGVVDPQPPAEQMNLVLDSVEHGLLLFLSDAARVRECRAALARLRPGSGTETTPAVSPSRASVRVQIPIRNEGDIEHARAETRALAMKLGFAIALRTKVVTIVSELARNIALYAGAGAIALSITPDGAIEIVALDRGPGIENLDAILRGEHKSRYGMGLGLIGVQRLAREFSVETSLGRGTTVRAVLSVA